MIRLFPRSLRLRVTILFALVFGIISGGAGLVTYRHLEEDLNRRIDYDLRTKAEYIRDIVGPRRAELSSWDTINLAIHEATETSGVIHHIQIVDGASDSLVVNSRPDLPDLTRLARGEGKNPSDLEVNGSHYRIFRRIAGTYNIFVVAPIDLIYHTLEEIRTTYFVFLPLALVLASVIVFGIVHRSLRPITNAARTADKITSQNLQERLPPPLVEDEVGELVHTLNRMIARLENAFTQITQFTADAAHELQTPLTILRGELEVALRKKNLDSGSLKLLQSNLDEVNRLISIVESLFTLARFDSNQLQVEFAPLELDTLLEGLFEKASVLAFSKNIEIRLSRNDPAVVKGDSYRLIQLFMNLITNAIRYTPEGGSIDLSCRHVNTHVIVRVSDTGIGIPASQIDKIFNRFYRVDKARSREMGGTGLGLAIVKWIVELHGGKINVQSEEGKGSTFEVVLRAA